MNDSIDHPSIVRLRAELDAAWKGIGALAQLEDAPRDRVVAELLTAVPDVASRTAREVGIEAVVAEIRRYADAGIPGASGTVPTSVIWSDVVRTASEAACATR
ncbi:hypothetical protein [Curtobacterium aurantiacum]|uniref:DUF222 domain-containing protein n=1 Tax=Curtobacterium aurantiacum TaxID=3236919 RepID=A0ABS5VBD0_9MICO|nr:hypothetical protein [Curtobacterium flaccumfaciens]MBT1544138.1 hypothetical protein [Curtobacterium flaccumfaciens pv. flaccumfaciens]MBT1586771.1 hypothetical protein [Curtobacterium flaccumfaciens pv. flaccumfaciens]MBT1676985.1 hypothetical protein [Curtobacterium flaccumfaciens pv. flaccumfaciens]MBT1681049.1 hypothetical protein [Curtobacterium flaccumfaciens pv. flaccumfaciens]